MSSRFTRWAVLEVFRPFVLAGNLLGKVWRVMFAGRDLELSRTREEDLAKEIRAHVPFLFENYQGRIVPDETVKHPQPFDFASVVVGVDNFLVRFFRGRGDLRVHIAQNRKPLEWHELHVVLSVIESTTISEPLFWSDIGRLLELHMSSLVNAFSHGNYPELQRQLSDVKEQERAAIRQWETETNRRLNN
jgi:hypothetical protein